MALNRDRWEQGGGSSRDVVMVGEAASLRWLHLRAQRTDERARELVGWRLRRRPLLRVGEFVAEELLGRGRVQPCSALYCEQSYLNSNLCRRLILVSSGRRPVFSTLYPAGHRSRFTL